MSAPSEPEKYSVDEMMEVLKNRPAEDPIEDGELVVRADGSQAIRVRKRKRRSQQPHKEERKHLRRVRMAQVSAALIIVLLAIFTAGVAVIFANSAPFRNGLLLNISRSTGADVNLEQFRMNPTSANADRLVLTWPDGNALHELTLRNVRADTSITSFFGKSLAGEELVCAEGSLTLQVPQPGKPMWDAPVTEGTLPIRFKRYAIPKAQVLLGDPAAPLFRMQNSEASFYPVSPNERTQLLVNRGDIVIAGWPKLRMDRAHIEFRGPEVDVVAMRLRHETDNRGVFELAGTVAPYTTDRASTLAVHLDAYFLSGIVGSELGLLFTGRIDTMPGAKSNCLSFTPGPKPDTSLAIEFHNSLTSPFGISGFQFLFGLSQTLGDTWFDTPEFDSNVSGILRRADGNVAISDLNFENKERMALRGALTMTPSRSLSGNLEVGLTDAMIKSAKTRRLDSLFGPPSGGFRWLTVKIGGTATAPTDNFKQLFEAAPAAKSSAPDSQIPTFEELTAPK